MRKRNDVNHRRARDRVLFACAARECEFATPMRLDVITKRFTTLVMVFALLSMTAVADPAITNLGFSGGAFQFSVTTVAEPNTGYIVEYKHNLSDASWTPLTSFLADGQVHQVKDSTPAPDHRFYRVRTVII